jgi:hypothetical protein
MPQLRQKVSASASRMMRQASTFWPAEQRPRMSSSTPPFTITTLQQSRPHKMNVLLMGAHLAAEQLPRMSNSKPPFTITTLHSHS